VQPHVAEVAARSSEDTVGMTENGTGTTTDEAQHGPSLPLAGSAQPEGTVDHAPEPADDAGEDNAGEAKDSDYRAEVTQLIQALRNKDYSWRAIAKRFNDDDVPTLSGKGRWNDRTLARFAGRMVVRKVGMVDGC
jgi:hypothetical protein